MKSGFLLAAMLLAASAAFAANGAANGETLDAKAAFARLKTLAGEWEATGPQGKGRVSYELIADGATLVERETPDKMHTMMTVYHLDGDNLLLTHYCILGNQPRMKAEAFHPDTGEVDFQFLDATNLSSPAASHMHNAKIRIVDESHATAEWQLYVDGKPKMTEAMQLTRVK